MPPRKGPLERLFHHFHEHPQGRFHEFLFFAALGGGLGVFTYIAWVKTWLNDAFAILLGIVAACLVGFAGLPQKRAEKPPPPPPGKRGQIAQQVKASKSEKRKGPPPPIQ